LRCTVNETSVDGRKEAPRNEAIHLRVTHGRKRGKKINTQQFMKTANEGIWQKSSTMVFWAEVASNDHLVQIYDNEDVIMESLEGFVSSGFMAGDGVVIIATAAHLASLDVRLTRYGYDMTAMRATDRFIPLDAIETLSKFMVNGRPDEALFLSAVRSIIARARGNSNRIVRAYGEMVDILWQQGHNGATLQLEHLWNRFCKTEDFCLFCAYPRSGFTQDPLESIMHICSTHARVIAGDVRSRSSTEVFYKTT
jgi:hypothetical protein